MNSMVKRCIMLVALIGSISSIQAARIDGASVNRMNPVQKSQLYRFINTNKCTCGCKLTVSRCLQTMKTCQHAPRIANSAIQKILASSNSAGRRPPFRRSAQPARKGNLNPALLGTWIRRTKKFSGGMTRSSTHIFVFRANGVVIYKSRNDVSGCYSGMCVRPSRGPIPVKDAGYWQARGNILHINWKKEGKIKIKYSIFKNGQTRGFKYGTALYKFGGR